MAVDYFLKLEGIEGESIAEGKEKQINVLSFSWGVSQTGTFGSGGGGGAGKASFSDINFMINSCKASAKLMAACATGTHIPSAVLYGRKAGKTQKDYYVITLTDCLVTSYQSSASSEVPTDSFTLNFAKIKFEYSVQDKEGVTTPAGKFEYDVQKVAGS